METGTVALLLDSVILIDHFSGVVAATEYLSRMQGRLAISVVTRAEVLTGFEPSQRRLPSRLLDQFPLFVIDRDVADLAATLRRKHAWKMPDAMQAAVAKQHRLKLVTRDTDDFPPERHRFVVVPYTV